MVISARPSLARLPSRKNPPTPAVGSTTLKYIDSLKFDASSNGCMYSSLGSSRSFTMEAMMPDQFGGRSERGVAAGPGS